MSKVLAVLLISPFVHAAPAWADSDGYYCVGPGYIAYETRFSAPPSQHLLHVIRFSSRQGISRIAPVVLEDFQVHAMNCGDGAIELRGWTTRYVVDIRDPSRPTITSETAPVPAPGSESANLGHWSREGVTGLEGDGPSGEFQLLIGRVSRRIPGGVEHYTISQVIRRETRPGGRILESLELFEGIFLETVD
jgi:hypothetical protein